MGTDVEASEAGTPSPAGQRQGKDVVKSYLRRYILRCEQGKIQKEPGPAIYALYLELLAEEPVEAGAPPLTGALGILVQQECARSQVLANAAASGRLLRGVDVARELGATRGGPLTNDDLKELPVLPRLDLMQALRVCLRTGRHDVLAELYFTVGSYDDAVEQALQVSVDDAKEYVKKLAETPPALVLGSSIASLAATAVHGEEQAFLNAVSAKKRGRAAAAESMATPAELRLRVYEYVQNVTAQSSQGLDKDEHRALLKRLWLRIAGRLVWQDGEKGPGEALALIEEASKQFVEVSTDDDAAPLLAVEDMLTLLPPETCIETFREQISDSLRRSEIKTRELQTEMD